MKTKLEILAGTDKTRLALLAARTERERSRSRLITCTACGESTYDARDPTDICEPCLTDLWGARAVLAGEYRSGKASGLLPVRLCNVPHWLEYPHMATDHEHIPPTASFRRGNENTSRTLQDLYVELFAGLAKALPCDPAGREDADFLIASDSGSYYSEHTMYARLPAETTKALRDLWMLIQWQSYEAYRQGHEAGHSLLARMNNGELGHEGFLEEAADAAGRLQEKLQKLARAPERKAKRRP